MSNRFWLGLILVILIVGGLGYGYLTTTDLKTANNNEMNKPSKVQKASAVVEEHKAPVAPDFVLKDLNGDMVQLSSFRGKVVILDFWATWCGPCRMEIPNFVELQDEYGDDKLVILGVSVDQGDLSVVPKFAEANKINYPILFHTPQVVGMYGGIQSIPTTFTIDKSGRVRDMAVGFHDKGYFSSLVDQLL